MVTVPNFNLKQWRGDQKDKIRIQAAEMSFYWRVAGIMVRPAACWWFGHPFPDASRKATPAMQPEFE